MNIRLFMVFSSVPAAEKILAIIEKMPIRQLNV